MPLMSNDEYSAVLALISKLSEQNEALKEEEQNIEQKLKKGRKLKEKHSRKNVSPLQKKVTTSRLENSLSRSRNRSSSPVVECPSTEVSRHHKICSSVTKGEEDMTTCWPNELFEQPVQDMSPSSSDFEGTILSRLVSFAYEEAKLVAQIIDTENKISCAGNVSDAKQEDGLDDHMIIPSQPTVLVRLPTSTPQEEEQRESLSASQTNSVKLLQASTGNSISSKSPSHLGDPNTSQPTGLATPTPDSQLDLSPIPSSSAKLLQASTRNSISSKSPSHLGDPNIVPSQPIGFATPTPDSQQDLPPIPSSSAQLLQASTSNFISSKLPSHSNWPKIITSEPTGLTTPSQDLQEVPKEGIKEHETLQPPESCAETWLSSSDHTCTKSSTSDIPKIVPPGPSEPSTSAPVYQQMALPPPNSEKINVKIICQACCSAARHRAISERKASIYEAVKEMNAIQECLDEVQDVMKTHSSIKDLLYLQESLSNVEVSILSAHFSLATAPQLDGDDDESIVSYKTPYDIITIWMDVDATKRRLSLLMAHAQECKMCKDSFDPTFYRIEEELLGLEEELKRYHNQEPIKSL